MKILVCLKEAFDSRLDLGFGQVDSELRRKGLACGWNPADAAALSLALQTKRGDESIAVLTIGKQEAEYLLRDALAYGASRALRIEDDPVQPYSPYNKAAILARAVAWMRADLVLVGGTGGGDGSGGVGPYMAGRLSWPFVYGAYQIRLGRSQDRVNVLRGAGRGLREVVECILPAVVAVEGDGRDLPYVSLDAVVAGHEAPIEYVTLAEVGISSEELRDEPVRVRKLSLPRPRPQPAPLDSSLPAYDRILALLSGGMQSRKVSMLEGETSRIVEQLFDLLIEKRVLKSNPGRRPADPT